MLVLNPQTLMDDIQNRVTGAVEGFFPFVGNKQTLRLKSIYVAEPKSVDDIAGQAKAKRLGRTWSVGVFGDLELVDNASGKVVNRGKKVKLLSIPALTRRYSFIVKGPEYQVSHLWRLKSGVYTRIARTGEPETQFNLAEGFNRVGFSLAVDPKTKNVLMRYRTTNVPLYSILKTLGTSDVDIEKAWGPQILKIGAEGSRPLADAKKLLVSMGDEVSTEESILTRLKERFAETKLRPDSTKLTLGKEFTTVDNSTLLAASNKLLRVFRGETPPDNRDEIPYKELLHVDDMLVDRLGRSERTIRRRVRNNLDKKSLISDIISSDIFGAPVFSFFTSTSIANQTPQTNPITMVSNHVETTPLGEDVGGIADPFRVTTESKMADRTQLGILDPVHTPEGERSGITLKLALGVKKKGRDVFAWMHNTKTKKMEHVSPAKLSQSNVAFPDQYSNKDGKYTPLTEKVTVQTPDTIKKTVDPSQVDYIIPHPTLMFSPVVNLVPFLQNDEGTRVEMATRHIEQALPLKGREAPLVQVQASPNDGGPSFEKAWAAFAAHPAPVAGLVVGIDKNEIVLRTKTGKEVKVGLYDNFPLNEAQAYLNSEPLVKVGDRVESGQIIADSNFTRDGVLALGKNLRVAYLPYKGLVFEDGIIVSETGAKKLTSLHLHKPSLYMDRDHFLDKKKFRMLFPAKLTAANADKLDDTGVVKIGETVEPGDVLVATAKKAEMSPERMVLRGIHKSLVSNFSDKSLVWPSSHRGEVVDVVRRGREIQVMVRTEEPAGPGDKVSGRHGNKGVISFVFPDDEMPYDKDGNVVDLIMNPQGVPGRMNPGQVAETELSRVAEAEGSAIAVRNFEPEAGRRLVKVKGHWRTVKIGPEKKKTKQIWVEPFEYERDYTEVVKDKLKEHGMSQSTELFDPDTKESFGDVIVGKQYILKLVHQAEKKFAARAWGPGYEYTINMEPKGGGKHGAQRIGEMGLYALLAHGAIENIREFQTYKCFIGPTLVETDKGPMRISQIVNGRLDVKVLSLTPEGVLEYRPITNYWKRPLAGEPLVTLEGYRQCPSGPYMKYKTRCTPGHEYFTDPTNKVHADEMEQAGWGLTPATTLSPSQRSVLVGSLFGDGYLGRSGHPYPWFQERHCVAQREYLQFKADVLGEYSRRELREYTTGHEGFSSGGQQVEWSTLGQPAFVRYHELFYSSGARRFPPEVFALLDLLALAVWFQDDGSTVVSEKHSIFRISLSAVAMLPEERERALARISHLTGAQLYVNKAGELRASGDTARVFLSAIAPYTHPSMEYKLRLVEGTPGTAFTPAWWEAVPGAAGVGPAHIPNVRPFGEEEYDRKNHGEHLYNLEVEQNHNYFANGLLVGNSDASQSEVWDAVQLGQPLPKPKVPFAFDKFVAYLNALGLDVERQDDTLVVMPFTDKEVKEVSAGELTDPGRMLRAKDLRPEPGGLFDPEATGGVGGTKFSHFNLPERFPNPVFDGPIRALLGLRKKDLDGLIAGTFGMKDGVLVPAEDADVLGPPVIVDLLSRINVDADLERAETMSKTAKASALDNLNKKIKYLRALKATGISAVEAYTMDKVLVLPPRFRPITAMDDGNLNRGDLNQLYRELGLSAGQLRDLPPEALEEQRSALRQEVFDGLKALQGLVGPTRKNKGILDIIAGDTPKKGYFTTRLIKRKQDLSARSIIVPNQDLQMDEVGVPERLAMEIFRPFVMQKLVLAGRRPLEAREAVLNKTPEARIALKNVIGERPVIMKRDPVLHKYGVMAFNVRLMGDREVSIHPLVCDGYNADFDGDAVSLHVPVSKMATAEAYKLLPSNNLLSPASGQPMFAPTKEAVVGMHLLTRVRAKLPQKEFATPDALIAAAEGKEIPWDTLVSVKGRQSTAGRELVRQRLPKAAHKFLPTGSDWSMGSKGLAKFLKPLAVEDPHTYPAAAQALKDLGFEHMHNIGFSFDLDTFKAFSGMRIKELKAVQPAYEKILASAIPQDEKDAKIVALYTKVGDKLLKKVRAQTEADDNPLAIMANAGVKPSWSQIKQILISPLLVEDSKGKVVPAPITSSYGEGMSLHDYWTGAAGVRKGITFKVQEVQIPGALTKQMVKSAAGITITEADCKTGSGVFLPANEISALDRYLSAPVKVKDATLQKGTLVTPGILSQLKMSKVSRIPVRSPLRCSAKKGICQTCYGVAADGNSVPKGSNVGILASQSLGERGTQLAMRVFHLGGVAGSGGGLVGAMDRLTQVLRMPAKIPGSATLSRASGKVTSVLKNPSGGTDVMVGGITHNVPALRKLTVVAGKNVSKGDPLSSGPINPQELLPLTNLPTVQNYLVNEITKLYDGEGIRRRHSEVLVKALTSLSKVEDPGGNDEFLRGDTVPTSMLSDWNDSKDRSGAPIEYTPVLKGVGTLPFHLYPDWLTQMNYQGLRDVLRRAASERGISKIHGEHPIPGVVYGKEFGQSDTSTY